MTTATTTTNDCTIDIIGRVCCSCCCAVSVAVRSTSNGIFIPIHAIIDIGTIVVITTILTFSRHGSVSINASCQACSRVSSRRLQPPCSCPFPLVLTQCRQPSSCCTRTLQLTLLLLLSLLHGLQRMQLVQLLCLVLDLQLQLLLLHGDGSC